MKTYALTIAFCPASQFAWAMAQWHNTGNCVDVDEHLVVIGHYPINRLKNNRDIKMIAKAYGIDCIDYGEDLGCAQTQTRVMKEMQDYDAFINVDPDSHCATNWYMDAVQVMDRYPDCVVVSCISPLVNQFLKDRDRQLDYSQVDSSSISIGIARQPTPFNMSLWRCEFFREIGGVPQLGERWGDTEAGVFFYANPTGKYHVYLMNHMEDESGKLLQDRQLLEYKDLHLRSAEHNKFYGVYVEYLRDKYPGYELIDTCIPDETVFK